MTDDPPTSRRRGTSARQANDEAMIQCEWAGGSARI